MKRTLLVISLISIPIVVILDLLFLCDRFVAYKELVQIGRINVALSHLNNSEKQASYKTIDHFATEIRIEQFVSLITLVSFTILFIFILKQFNRRQLS